MADKVVRESRDATRLLEPGPVGLITSRFRSAENVMTAAWMMPVSLDPPLIAVAIHPGRLTHEYVSRSEYFAINLPNAELLAAVHLCGTRSGRDGDKFTATGLTARDAVEVEAPLVEECVAYIECGLVSRASFGDHDLFVAQPLAVAAVEEAFNGRWLPDSDAGQTLHHLRADYYATLSKSYQSRLEADQSA